jgi:hypothetical protein
MSLEPALGPNAELSGEELLPGFRCRVSDLFAGLPEVPTKLSD